MEEQKIPQLKKKEVIDAVVATLNENRYDQDRVAIEVCTFEPNHVIEVAAWEYTI